MKREGYVAIKKDGGERAFFAEGLPELLRALFSEQEDLYEYDFFELGHPVCIAAQRRFDKEDE